MDIDTQIQALIEDAPQDGTTPQLVRAIAPVLKSLSAQLVHTQYYILQTLDQGWVMTTLSNRTQPKVEKNVIYAFPTLQDVSASPHSLQNPEVMAIPVPVTHILFRMMAMKTVHSTIFFETPGNVAQGKEINRQDIENLIQMQLRGGQAAQVPPDIA
ncbi:MAG: hypothetical protein F6K19_37840 [Cyanothece sp. SIO1E1]|nr:hypothetical protein [Cyanothece sp. SIO1E1]